jgi:hypothetical protein
MTEHVEKAWRAWMTAANAVDGARVTTPQREANKQARIVKFKNRYEQALRASKVQA